jgi:UDP-glucuronate 4-epimerase
MKSIDTKRHILVTGSAGFIGSNLISSLLKTGNFIIYGLDNFDDFYSKSQKLFNMSSFIANDSFKFIESDISDIELIDDINDISAIIHLAGKAGVRPSILNPLVYNDVNVRGTQILLEYARKKNIKHFVFASSSSVYGVNQNFPWNEEDILFPISPYASTKLSGELMGHVFSHLYGIRFIALRFFTVYGPGQRPDLAINKFFNSILNDEPITVFGDGSTSRDYTYIDDIVSGISAAIDYDQSNFEIFNLGNNNLVTLNTLIKEIENICKKSAIVDRYPEQLGDVRKTYADISKAKKLLGYNPLISLKEGLNNFFDWKISIDKFLTNK